MLIMLSQFRETEGKGGREKNEDTWGEEGMGFTDDRTNVFE